MNYKEKFKTLLSSVNRKGINELIDYLENETDFFDAWASTSFHCNYDGGLVEHSLNVAEYAMKLAKAWDSKVSKESIILCACGHDIGKSNYYVPNLLKSGNPSGSKPKKINPELKIKNHALRSVLTVSKFIELTEEERVCILTHDGFYESTNREYWLDPSELMMIVHFADLHVARNVEQVKCYKKE